MIARFAATVLVAAALAPAACGGFGGGSATPAYPAEPDALTVVAAENFYGDILHQLGGTHLRVFSILSDPNADPHEYETNSGNARAVADAGLVVENGLGYDAFMDRLLRASPRPRRVVLNVADLAGAAAGANPHVWYDPTVMPRLARAAAAALAQLDPAHASNYGSGLERVLAALGDVSARVSALHASLAGAPVAATEPVFEYMATALGLDVRSPAAFMKAVEQGNDPPARAVAEQQDLLSTHAVKALLMNSQATTKATSTTRDLALRSGIPVVPISETEPRGTTFQAWQLDTLARVAAAVGTAS